MPEWERRFEPEDDRGDAHGMDDEQAVTDQHPGEDVPWPAESLADKVYREIRDRIIAGTYAQGSRLREREIADALGVSRIPVREALPRLQSDGFITTSPRRGATVAELTMRDIEELYAVRLGVDVYGTRLATQRVAAGASPAALVAAVDAADDALASGDFAAIIATNADIHEVIIELAENSLLSALMRPVSGRARWISRLSAYPDPRVACREHHDLRDAICSGNADLAVALAYAHIEGGREPTLEVLKGILLPD
jgi:DNA-binding GntR family transcriptional regulator